MDADTAVPARVFVCVCLLTEQDFVLEEVGRDPDADCGW